MLPQEYILVLSPLICFLLNLIIQIVSFRIWHRLGLLRSEYVGFTAGLVLIVFINALMFFVSNGSGWQNMSGYMVLTIVTYSALGYCYFHFVNLGETARRIRLMRELLDAGGKLSHESIVVSYPVEEIVARRINRLTGTRQITERGGCYYIANPVMLVIAGIIVSFKVLLIRKECKHDD